MTKKGINILPLIGAGAGSSRTIQSLASRNWENARLYGTLEWTGYNLRENKLQLERATGLIGLITGAVGSKIATKIGINRYLPNIGGYSIRL